MSDYFGALMNLSGLIGAPRSPASIPTDAPAAGTDIVETDEVREIAASPPSLPSQPGSPTIAPSANLDSAAAKVAPAEAEKPSLTHAPAATDVLHPVPLHAESVSAARVSPIQIVPAAAAVAAPILDQRNAVIRAALEWVAADPQDAVITRDIVAAPARGPASEPPTAPRRHPVLGAAREQPARSGVGDVDILRTLSASRTEVPARRLAHAVDTAATGTSSQTHATPPARVVRVEPPQSARPATRFAPATVSDEIVEISIGAIHVRVDAPTPQTLTRAPPAAPPSSAQMSERSAASSALARRALRRI